MNNTPRTFSDLDLNFLPAPSSRDRYTGQGLISIANNSSTIGGINTYFINNLSNNDNLYVNNIFIGKIKTILSDTSLNLINKCSISNLNYAVPQSSLTTNLIFDSTNIIPTISSAPSLMGTAVTVKLATTGISNGSLIHYQLCLMATSDLFVEDYNNHLYGNIDGYFVVNNNSALVIFTLVPNSSDKPLILEFISNSGIELITMFGASYTHATPGDITLNYDRNAVKSSIRNLILTMNYERHFNSSIGSQAKALLFEPATSITQINIIQSITNVINAYEPRVNLISVNVNLEASSHNVNIAIIFNIINTTDPISINMILDRTR